VLKEAYNNIIALSGSQAAERQNKLHKYAERMMNEKFYGDKETYAG